MTDSISVAHGIPGLCGSITYTIADTPAAGVTALSATELSIDSVTGVVSVWTGNAATIGVHTVTVTAKLATYPAVLTT